MVGRCSFHPQYLVCKLCPVSLCGLKGWVFGSGEDILGRDRASSAWCIWGGWISPFDQSKNQHSSISKEAGE